MIGYSEIESSIRDRILAHFITELNENRCKIGDLDGIYSAIFDEGSDYGCLLEQAPLRKETRAPFNTPVWTYQVDGLFFIRYGDDVETKLRLIIDKLLTTFDADPRVGGKSPKVEIVEIGRAEPAQVNDQAFYWLPFVIEAIDR